jgi:hypothetical protein
MEGAPQDVVVTSTAAVGTRCRASCVAPHKCVKRLQSPSLEISFDSASASTGIPARTRATDTAYRDDVDGLHVRRHGERIRPGDVRAGHDLPRTFAAL